MKNNIIKKTFKESHFLYLYIKDSDDIHILQETKGTKKYIVLQVCAIGGTNLVVEVIEQEDFEQYAYQYK